MSISVVVGGGQEIKLFLFNHCCYFGTTITKLITLNHSTALLAFKGCELMLQIL